MKIITTETGKLQKQTGKREKENFHLQKQLNIGTDTNLDHSFKGHRNSIPDRPSRGLTVLYPTIRSPLKTILHLNEHDIIIIPIMKTCNLKQN